jgi:hypothetical protein
MPSKRTNKLSTHAHHSDRSIAAAIFANGTYFVDMPQSYNINHSMIMTQISALEYDACHK